MTEKIRFANEIREYLLLQEGINSCTLCGSIANNSYDQYSDIDMEIDVSGYDNSQFVKEIPVLLSKQYSIIFCDYAPSLMPEAYVISVAVDADNPFLFIDIKCVATPHLKTLSKKDFINDPFEHILKLWVINLKHWLRNQDCKKDILKMGSKVLDVNDLHYYSEKQILEETLVWLEDNMHEKHIKYVESCSRWIKS
ncbi:MAG: hypothetical protein ACRC1P_01700 [Cellulosilyticaceae bacterium]